MTGALIQFRRLRTICFLTVAGYDGSGSRTSHPNTISGSYKEFCSFVKKVVTNKGEMNICMIIQPNAFFF